MNLQIKSYFSGIEEKIIELISSAQKKVYIAVAWFTSNEIKNALLDLNNSKVIDLKVLVDDNETNRKYYFGNEEFNPIYVKSKKFSKEFLHHKFILIDEEIIITGSYNLSNKARKNLENIVVITSPRLYDNYSRIFRFLYEDIYIDGNVELLNKYHDFARNLLSTYYKFSKKEFVKYETKIEMGQFYSYFNGYNDQYSYSPGLIFNESIKLKNVSTTDIFHKNYHPVEGRKLPIDKNTVKQKIKDNQINNIIDSFSEYEDLYHLINDEVHNAEKSLEHYFERKIDSCYTCSELEKLINSDIDIIIEDELWKTNFSPFLNKVIVENIFKTLEPI